MKENGYRRIVAGILYSVLGVIILGSAGCTSLGHKNVSPDRFNYNEAISRSTQEQMLLNLVRLRFFETPVFLAVSSVLKKNKKAFERDFNQYFKNKRWISNPFTKGAKFNLSEPFQKEAAGFGMDWLQLMAQGFQESGLKQQSKSPYGAVGIMQVLPSTAKWLGVSNYMELEGNIHAGAKYMNKLLKRYAKDPKISKDNRFFFALAAYNAGPGRVIKYRKRAVKLGYNPNIWFNNVELVALRSGNLETVMYV